MLILRGYIFKNLFGTLKILSSLNCNMKRTAQRTAKLQAQKKTKATNDDAISSSSVDDLPETHSSKNKYGEFQKSISYRRLSTATDIREFAFKKKRVRVLSVAQEVPESNRGGIVYWMSRDARVQDNWALLFAQKLAFKLELPLIVVFCVIPKFLNATLRHYKFMLSGLEEVERECHQLNIPFCLLLGSAVEKLPQFVKQHNIGAVICDFAPLRVPMQWVEDVKNALPADVPFTQVDAHNIVPVWIASDKQEYSARTIRGKINAKLNEFLTEYPPVVKHPHAVEHTFADNDWKAVYDSLDCDRTVDVVDWAKPGYAAACKQLESFCNERLRMFNEKRNDPTMNALSGLSPWFHFGQISVQRCVLEVKRFKSKNKDSVEAFCEEAIVRRELADNFCFYNENYDNINGLHAWAFKTLNDHRKDKRSPSYTLEQFEVARTHDDLWNAAQLQLVREGKMHGFLRMYWAKKILEWSSTPEHALEYAILLNDKYSLDGRDPNGYVGCMWSIGGIHDQGWAERPIFGKIRYMNYKGCQRKFDVAEFVARYAAKSI